MFLTKVATTCLPSIFLYLCLCSYKGSLFIHNCVLKQLILGIRGSSCVFVRADILPHSFRLNVFSFFSLEVCQHFRHVSQESVWRTTACASLFTKYWSFISFLRGNFVLCSEIENILGHSKGLSCLSCCRGRVCFGKKPEEINMIVDWSLPLLYPSSFHSPENCVFLCVSKK